MLNNKRSQYANDYHLRDNASGASATTFMLCLAYVRMHRPRVVVSENVLQILDGCPEQEMSSLVDNLEQILGGLKQESLLHGGSIAVVLSEWEKIGYIAIPIAIHAEKNGSLCRRSRLYVLAWDVNIMPVQIHFGVQPACHHTKLSDFQTYAAELLARIQSAAPRRKLQDVLKPRGDGELLDILRQRIQGLLNKKGTKEDWADHDTIFRAYGFHGHRDISMLPKVTDLDAWSLDPLTQRQQDLVFFFIMVKDQPSLGLGDLVVYDLFHSLKFLHKSCGSVNLANTVCPNSSLFVRGPGYNRILTPQEVFSIMGYDLHAMGVHMQIAEGKPPARKRTRSSRARAVSIHRPSAVETDNECPQWSCSDLQDLIGNAFEGTSFLSACIVLLGTLGAAMSHSPATSQNAVAS